jgi:hypothetical protein
MSSGYKIKAVIVLTCVWSLDNATVASADDPTEKLLELYKNQKLFDKGQYPAVRSACASIFAAKHEQTIRKALAGDYESMMPWLDAHPKLKENFFTALDDRYDKIEPAFQLFRDIWRQFPQQLEKYPEVGIAVAVSWDDPKAVYDYTHHQERTKSKMPAGLVGGIDNFRYLVETPLALEGRLQNLPWEFLIFLVDHKTPLAERAWARQYYQTHRNSKSWHQDVPYDHGMLKAEKAKEGSAGANVAPKLQGFEYTLENIRTRGGVCAMQADFAARVAKSVGIPAVYSRAESARGGFSHAWWTYFQIHNAASEDIKFTVHSDGQTVGFIKDAFYVGQVRDPHTGRTILDVDMLRWLTQAGHDRAGLRHATLLMRHYEWLAQKLGWDSKERMDYLDKCIRICPLCDEPWKALAPIAKSKDLDPERRKALKARVSSILTVFKNYPDFINRAFSDLLDPLDPAEQIKLDQQAVALCEKVNRPDLSCDLRLRISDALVKDKRWQTAGEGLIGTIYRFPTEGRYVPKLTQKLQQVAPNYKGGTEKLAKVYLDIVPKLYVYYRDDTSAGFHKTLYAQAMTFFESNQMTKYAATLKATTGQ